MKYVDVKILEDFYSSDFYKFLTGEIVDEIVKSFLHEDRHKTYSTVGLGYCMPYFESINYFSNSVCLMPANIGATQWPVIRPFRVAVVDEQMLPISTNSVNEFFSVHYLEFSSNFDGAISEIARCLKVDGSFLVILSVGLLKNFVFPSHPFGIFFSKSVSEIEKIFNNHKLYVDQKVSLSMFEIFLRYCFCSKYKLQHKNEFKKIFDLFSKIVIMRVIKKDDAHSIIMEPILSNS